MAKDQVRVRESVSRKLFGTHRNGDLSHTSGMEPSFPINFNEEESPNVKGFCSCKSICQKFVQQRGEYEYLDHKLIERPLTYQLQG